MLKSNSNRFVHRLILNKPTQAIEAVAIPISAFVRPSHGFINYDLLLDQKISDYKAETRKAVENILKLCDK